MSKEMGKTTVKEVNKQKRRRNGALAPQAGQQKEATFGKKKNIPFFVVAFCLYCFDL